MPAYKDTKKGTWYAKFRYTDWQGNRKETTKRGFPTKREAKEYEEEYKRKAQGTADMTLESLWEIYAEDRRQHIKQSSLYSFTHTVTKHILPTLGKLPLSSITPNVIRKWQNQLTGINPSTTLTVNRRLSALLNFAVKYYGLARNPMKVTGTKGKMKKQIEFWSKEEFETFISYVKNPLYKSIFLLLFYSGMRVGEALALNIDDIDFTTCTVTINKALSRNEITTPKTSFSYRQVTLPSFVTDNIKDTIERLSHESGRIFPITYTAVFQHYKKGIALSHVRPLKLHCLRHAHASLLIAKGVPVTAVSKRLGHASPQITMSIYAHPTQDSDKEIAHLLEHF